MRRRQYETEVAEYLEVYAALALSRRIASGTSSDDGAPRGLGRRSRHLAQASSLRHHGVSRMLRMRSLDFSSVSDARNSAS